MRKLLWVVGVLAVLALAAPAHAQNPPDESAFVVAMVAQTGDLIKNDSYAFTDTVCAALAQKDPNWGRKVRRAGDWSSRNSDAIAYRFGSDDNKALVDIVYNSTDPGGPPMPNAAPAWQVFPAPNTGNGFWMKCYEPPMQVRQFGNDFDGDGRLDVAVYRPSSGTWFILESHANATTWKWVGWGNSADIPVPGDYDGDGKADVAVWRPSEGTWYIVYSSTGAKTGKLWGSPGDVPVPGDYDGDGKADLCVWRPSEGRWYWLKSSSNYSWANYGVKEWGKAGDVPAPGDYDGDGKADLCVWRPSDGRWYWLKSTAGYSWASYGAVQWGVAAAGDQLVPADYDGDGKTDLAVWRPGDGKWYWLKSTDNYSWSTFGSKQWGGSGDVVAPADYDGDGKADLVLFRPSAGAWYAVLSTTGGTFNITWGIVGDKPL
jgi:hypothetical protein